MWKSPRQKRLGTHSLVVAMSRTSGKKPAGMLKRKLQVLQRGGFITKMLNFLFFSASNQHAWLSGDRTSTGECVRLFESQANRPSFRRHENIVKV